MPPLGRQLAPLRGGKAGPSVAHSANGESCHPNWGGSSLPSEALGRREGRRVVAHSAPCTTQVLLAASWDDGVQQAAAVALANFAHQPYNRTAVVRAGALAPLLEQLSSPSPGVVYHAAQALMAMQ